MTYDAANRLAARRYPDGRRCTFAYDASDNRTLMADATGRTSFSYDLRNNRLLAVNPDAKRVSYAYDAMSRRTTMRDPDDGRFTYTHDLAGRLTALANSKGERTTLAYDKNDRLVRKELHNGNVTTQVYDADGRMLRIINARADGSLVSRFTYTYDCAGNRTGLVQFDGTNTFRTTWTYDDTYQLAHEHRSGPHAFNVTYTYDAAGNRTLEIDSGDRTTYTHDAANQLLAEVGPDGRTTYTYDACGNRTQKESGGGTTYYAWDEDNRLVEAEPPAGAVTLTYNADGQRVRKESPTDHKKLRCRGIDVGRQQRDRQQRAGMDALIRMFQPRPGQAEEIGSAAGKIRTGARKGARHAPMVNFVSLDGPYPRQVGNGPLYLPVCCSVFCGRSEAFRR